MTFKIALNIVGSRCFEYEKLVLFIFVRTKLWVSDQLRFGNKLAGFVKASLIFSGQLGLCPGIWYN